MRTAKYFLMAVLTLGLAAGLSLFRAADDKPKYTIEEVMEKAHKPAKASLFFKVKNGKATTEEKKQLLELYEELAKNKPEKGSQEDWKTRTSKMVKAAKGVVEDKAGSVKQLVQAADCGKCHSMHKPD